MSPAVSERTPVRDAIVAAARELTVTRGWASVRMVDVATAAGVSRQTVYNEFGDRARLAEALAGSEIRRFAATVRTELFAHDRDARAAGHAAILTVLTEAADNPLVRDILTGDRGGGDELLPYLTTRSEAVLAAAGEVVNEWISVRRPDVPEPTARLAAEAVIRLTVSHIVLATAPPEATAAALAEVFVRLLS